MREAAPAPGLFVLADARVMAGGQALRTDLPRHAHQRLELYVGVALGAGDGRSAGEILLDERAHHARFKFLLEINYIVRKLQVLRDTLRVVHVVQRATAVLRGAVALQFGE